MSSLLVIVFMIQLVIHIVNTLGAKTINELVGIEIMHDSVFKVN